MAILITTLSGPLYNPAIVQVSRTVIANGVFFVPVVPAALYTVSTVIGRMLLLENRTDSDIDGAVAGAVLLYPRRSKYTYAAPTSVSTVSLAVYIYEPLQIKIYQPASS